MELHNLIDAGNGTFVVSELVVEYDDVIKMAKTLISSKMRVGEGFTNPGLVRDYLVTNYSQEERELFGVIFLDTQHRLISVEILFYGTISSAPIYPREIVKSALAVNAAAVLLFHNHPSGEAEPSSADKRATERITTALDTVEIKVLDHLVIGGSVIVSFAERGFI